jgi:hypothetical protein
VNEANVSLAMLNQILDVIAEQKKILASEMLT